MEVRKIPPKGQTTCKIVISRIDFMLMLQQYAARIGITDKIPDDADVEITVPSGGDYSGMDIDVATVDTPIVVSWKKG